MEQEVEETAGGGGDNEEVMCGARPVGKLLG